MAEALKPLGLLLSLAIAGTASHAAPLVDPTQPPPGYRADGSALEYQPEDKPREARLQMIVRGPGETRIALIDGKPVRAGDRLAWNNQSMRVARITDGGVELVAGEARATIELVPGASGAVRCAANKSKKADC